MPDRLLIRRGMPGTFGDNCLARASHHAAIPDHNAIETLALVWPRLSADERRLFDVPDLRYRQTTALLDMPGLGFRAAGRQPAEETGDEAQMLRALRSGETAALSELLVEGSKTWPPPRYNEGTLIKGVSRSRSEPAAGLAAGMDLPASISQYSGGDTGSDLLSEYRRQVAAPSGLVGR